MRGKAQTQVGSIALLAAWSMTNLVPAASAAPNTVAVEDGRVFACVAPKSGIMRVPKPRRVDGVPTVACRPAELMASWSVTGSTGATGPQGPSGLSVAYSLRATPPVHLISAGMNVVAPTSSGHHTATPGRAYSSAMQAAPHCVGQEQKTRGVPASGDSEVRASVARRSKRSAGAAAPGVVTVASGMSISF